MLRRIATVTIAALVVCGGAVPASAAPGKVAPTCHGKRATKVVTKMSQLVDLGDGEWEIRGTSANDVIVVALELPPVDDLTVSLRPWHSRLPDSVGGGRDEVCVTLANATNSWNALRIYGGNKVTATGAAYTYLNVNEAGTYDITGARVEIALATIEPSTVSVTNVPKGEGTTFTQVTGSRGADDISVKVQPGFTSASVSVSGGEGNDTIAIDAPAEAQTLLIGGAGEDTITSGSSADLVYGAEPVFSGKVLAPVGAISRFDDAATAMLNHLFGSLPGAISAHGASDTAGNAMSTGGGNDRVYGSDGDDEIRSGGGNDWVDALVGRDRLWGGTGKDTLNGGSGNDDVYGENDDDTLYGGSGTDLIKGGTGKDKLKGESGNDVLHGNEQDDRVEGGTGNDSIYGQSGNDWLRGNDGSDAIDGGSGTDDCTGGAGSDELKGCNP